jgi:hypothetical protein
MKNSLKILQWTPRILCILAILFMSMFASDSFSPGNTVWQNIGALLMHLVPSFTLVVVLIIAWKWELVGGIILTVIGIAWSIFVYILNYRRTGSVGASLLIILMLGIPFVLAGILFIISHYKRKN